MRFYCKNCAAALLCFLVFFNPVARGVIFYTTADPSYNTTAPTGALSNSGWQWQGNWGGFLGTPISAHHFIAANHVGGNIGDPFTINGVVFTTVNATHDSSSDLVIWEIDGTFSSWAPLYDNANEVGQSLVVMGRGLSRGDEVRVNGILKGWMWGSNGGVLRWGQNQVSSITNGGAGLGDLLYATFDAGGGANEAHLAVGDSSGAVFIQDAGEWKLAGISYAVDAYFNTTNSGSGFEAALFDASGLYYGSTDNWSLVTNHIPSGFYATRISNRLAWINSVIATDASPNDVPLFHPHHLIILAIGIFLIGVRQLRNALN